MNWLAHLRLAPDRPLLRIGNLAGDFVRGVDLATLHPELVRGVHQHRAIDAFVDAHPAVRAARGLVPNPWSRFAGVLVDVYFDHFLAAAWDRLGDGGALPRFAAARYDELEVHAELLPPRLQRALPYLRAEDWLASYAELDGLAMILARMSRRSDKLAPLAEAWRPLADDPVRYAEAFAVLWPELTAYAATAFAER
ncbi:MAG: Acyl carrier protein phosphodiesterase [Planctomycetota bacterium]